LAQQEQEQLMTSKRAEDVGDMVVVVLVVVW